MLHDHRLLRPQVILPGGNNKSTFVAVVCKPKNRSMKDNGLNRWGDIQIGALVKHILDWLIIITGNRRGLTAEIHLNSIKIWRIS